MVLDAKKWILKKRLIKCCPLMTFHSRLLCMTCRQKSSPVSNAVFFLFGAYNTLTRNRNSIGMIRLILQVQQNASHKIINWYDGCHVWCNAIRMSRTKTRESTLSVILVRKVLFTLVSLLNCGVFDLSYSRFSHQTKRLHLRRNKVNHK